MSLFAPLAVAGLEHALGRNEPVTIGEVADGAIALVLAELARIRFAKGADVPALVVFVARDGLRQAEVQGALTAFAPEIEVLSLPAWDCQPYDRASPNASVLARRMECLARLVRSRGGARPRVLITTVNAALQKLPPAEFVARQSFSAAPGNALDIEDIARWLEVNGYSRGSTVRDVGEYAVRGGIVDLFPPGFAEPVRLDFFGDTLESIRAFDPETQRSSAQLRGLDLVPMSEFQLTTDTIKRFRQGYLSAFGANLRGDTLYEHVSEGRRHIGMEHWLPLFHAGLDPLEVYVPGATFVVDAQADGAAEERLAQISDYYDARKSALEDGAGGVPYHPLPPEALYRSRAEWTGLRASAVELSGFSMAPGGARAILAGGTRKGRDFAAERNDPNANVFEAAAQHAKALQAQGKRVVFGAASEGARDRLGGVLADHGLKAQRALKSLRETADLAKGEIGLVTVALQEGFETSDLALISEEDILGERMTRPKRSKKRAKDFITELTSLKAGDIVVHVDHGIGRFVALNTITVAGAPHDCLEIHYAGGDKLFLPVENIELLTRYGSEETDATLDRLGGGAWQARKAKLKARIRDMARALIRIAAQRLTREAPRLTPPDGLYEEFVARFPFDETEDQQATIDAVFDDLGSGRPMDRLVCGDVGFGKTEVALRAAFVAAMNGKQVAVVVPTTLLARQHFKTFQNRFSGLPLRLAQASRLVPAADLKKTKEELAEGKVDIIVGTHALLSKSIRFKDLGLLIVDEEQHFGVAHKERLKEIRAEIHVLTLSATPIPRTLQLAMTGVRELSIIATPPVDRLAVRSFVAPFDALVVREALLRERYRGGQSFYVVPRIDDLAEVRAFLEKNVPEVRVGVGHGQMSATDLEQVMSDFYDGKFDVLLSTTIVESGLDIPSANTLIIHRADMFGLGQLYQLRGRVGRSKTRAYALFTLPVNRTITPNAERRLKVLQSLDTLGAGFQLASHDLDIRGAGNLLGDEQSGHIKEVGYELYQQMLEEAIAALKAGLELPEEEAWSPTIALGTPVLIPESYIADLDIRMALYRRLSQVENEGEIEGFAAEMIDRFGPLPPEIGQLMKIVAIKLLCRRAHVEKVDAGPKGIIVAFKDNSFANPNGLVKYVTEKGTTAKVRPDMKIVFAGAFEDPAVRLAATRDLMTDIARIAEKRK
ncbi:MAG: transcription-repair coupling factor [Beijerinckiaceae bacterium]|nr:MAG: transcription-repair coupling factor [Beijerinckiaceae bacterium]